MRKLSFAALLSVIILHGCIQFEREEVPDGNTRISDNAIIFSEGEWTNAVISMDTSEYTFTFFEGYDIGLGDVIVSAADSGYLRKVTAVQQAGNGVEVSTSEAFLSDVIECSDTAFTIQLIPDMIDETIYLKKGASVELSARAGTAYATALNYNISATLGDGSVEFTGVYNLDASLKLGWKISGSAFASMVAEVDQLNHLELTSVIDPGEAYTGEEKICTQLFKPYVVWAGVPLVIIPEVSLYAGISVSDNYGMEVSVDQELDLQASEGFSENLWAGYAMDPVTIQGYEALDLTADIEATAYIRSRLDFKLYGTPLLRYEDRIFHVMEADREAFPWWTLTAGDTGVIRVFPEILDPLLPDIDSNLVVIAFRDTLGQSVSPWFDPTPQANFMADVTSVNTGETIQFTDLTTSDPTGWHWEFGDGDTSILQNPEHVYTSAGSYDVTLVASNAFSSDTITKFDYIIVTKIPGGR